MQHSLILSFPLGWVDIKTKKNTVDLRWHSQSDLLLNFKDFLHLNWKKDRFYVLFFQLTKPNIRHCTENCSNEPINFAQSGQEKWRVPIAIWKLVWSTQFFRVERFPKTAESASDVLGCFKARFSPEITLWNYVKNFKHIWANICYENDLVADVGMDFLYLSYYFLIPTPCLLIKA